LWIIKSALKKKKYATYCKVGQSSIVANFLYDALERKDLQQHYDLVLVHNTLFEDDEDDDSTNNQYKGNSVS
jgi:hypothetical protein